MTSACDPLPSEAELRRLYDTTVRRAFAELEREGLALGAGAHPRRGGAGDPWPRSSATAADTLTAAASRGNRRVKPAPGNGCPR